MSTTAKRYTGADLPTSNEPSADDFIRKIQAVVTDDFDGLPGWIDKHKVYTIEHDAMTHQEIATLMLQFAILNRSISSHKESLVKVLTELKRLGIVDHLDDIPYWQARPAHCAEALLETGIIGPDVKVHHHHFFIRDTRKNLSTLLQCAVRTAFERDVNVEETLRLIDSIIKAGFDTSQPLLACQCFIDGTETYQQIYSERTVMKRLKRVIGVLLANDVLVGPIPSTAEAKLFEEVLNVKPKPVERVPSDPTMRLLDLVKSNEASTLSIKAFIDQGADLSFTDKTVGRTILGWAVMKASREIVQCLLDLGANVHAVDAKGLSILQLAFKRSMGYNGAVVRAVIEAGADTNVPISCYPKHVPLPLVQAVIEIGGNVDLKFLMDHGMAEYVRDHSEDVLRWWRDGTWCDMNKLAILVDAGVDVSSMDHHRVAQMINQCSDAHDKFLEIIDKAKFRVLLPALRS